jgi:hypothetical protein
MGKPLTKNLQAVRAEQRVGFEEWRAFADLPWTSSVEEFEPLVPLDD